MRAEKVAALLRGPRRCRDRRVEMSKSGKGQRDHVFGHGVGVHPLAARPEIAALQILGEGLDARIRQLDPFEVRSLGEDAGKSPAASGSAQMSALASSTGTISPPADSTASTKASNMAGRDRGSTAIFWRSTITGSPLAALSTTHSRPGLAGRPPAGVAADRGDLTTQSDADLERSIGEHHRDQVGTVVVRDDINRRPRVSRSNPSSANTARSAICAGPVGAPHHPRDEAANSVPSPCRCTMSPNVFGVRYAHMRPSGSVIAVGANRWPPVWLTRNISASRSASAQWASSTPRVPQQMSWEPWTQISTVRRVSSAATNSPDRSSSSARKSSSVDRRWSPRCATSHRRRVATK